MEAYKSLHKLCELMQAYGSLWKHKSLWKLVQAHGSFLELMAAWDIF